MLTLDTPLREVVGKTAAALAEKPLYIETVGDLLRHYPRRWDRRGELTNLAELRADEYATIFARVESVTSRTIRANLVKTDVRVTDGRGQLTLTFFSKRDWQKNNFSPGVTGYFAGKVDVFNRKLQLVNPEFEPAEEIDDADVGFAGAILPIYPASAKASSLTIRRSMRIALDGIELPIDPMPRLIRDKLDLLDLRSAFEGIHRPKDYSELNAAKHRLKFDEAFILQVAMAQRRPPG